MALIVKSWLSLRPQLHDLTNEDGDDLGQSGAN